MKMLRYSVLMVLSICAAMGAPDNASGVVLTASQDAFLDESRPNTPLGCPPAAPVISVGYVGGAWRERGLVGFDLSQIPPGTQIQSAVLRVWVMGITIPGRDVQAFLVANPWDECTVTWNNQPGNWITNEAQAHWEGLQYQCMDVTNLIRLLWENPGQYPNYGLKFYSQETSDGDVQFATRELGEPSRRPMLYVNECPPLDAPSGMAPCSVQLPDGTTSVTVSWSTVACATFYRVELYRNADCSGSFWQWAETNTTSWTFSGLTNGGYSWHVQALNTACSPTGSSPWSSCCTFQVGSSPPITGACCFVDGSCQVLTQSDCTGVGGTYQGDGTSCDPNPCPQPPTEPCAGVSEVEIPGNFEGWTPTGVTVWVPGEVFWIRSTGRIDYAGVGYGSNPDGCRTYLGPDSCYCRVFDPGEPYHAFAPGLLLLSLVGRIGDGQPFFVGRDLYFSASETGPLFLAYNDVSGTYFDNYYSFRATVCTHPCADLGPGSGVGETGSLAGPLKVGNVRPNPFSGSTATSFSLSLPTHVRVEVLDAAGRHIVTLKDGMFGAGIHAIDWDARGENGKKVAAGVYFVRVHSQGKEVLKKAVLIR